MLPPDDDTPRPPSRFLRVHRRVCVPLLWLVAFPVLVFVLVRFEPLQSYRFVLILGAWAWLSIRRAIRRRRRDGRGALAFNVGVLLLAVASAEFYLGLTDGPRARFVGGLRSKPDRIWDAAIGYVPNPDTATHIRLAREDETIFENTVTISSDGLRIRPPQRVPPPTGSVLCFGCSFMFGYGLEDDEAIPWRLEQRLGGRLRCYNFAFTGWGPHHMLANLEGGRVRQKVAYEPRFAFYLAIPDHARRVSGVTVYDRYGPRYLLAADGTARRAGQFSDDTGALVRRRVLRYLRASHLGRRIIDRIVMGQGSIPLLAAVVDAARKRVVQTWPACRFIVLLWDARRASDPVAKAFEERGLEVHRVSAVLPGFPDPARYTLHPTDAHPNAAAADAIARYLAEDVIGR